MSTTTINESGEPLHNAGRWRSPRDDALAAVVGGAGVVAAAVPFVLSFQPSERAKAAGAPVEADIGAMAPGEMRTFEWQGQPGVDSAPHAGNARSRSRKPTIESPIRSPSARRTRPRLTRTTNTARSSRSILVVVGICSHLGCKPIGPFRVPVRNPAARRRSRVCVPVSWFDVRPGRPRVQEQACARQPSGAAAQVRVRIGRADRRRLEGVNHTPCHSVIAMGLHNTEYKGLLGWIDARMPTLMSEFKKHASEYYAPKNFNFWYYLRRLSRSWCWWSRSSPASSW